MVFSGEPWYREGLRARCTRCGNCCRGNGNVWISDEEIALLAESEQMTEPQFRSAFTRRAEHGEAMLRQKRNQDCVFFAAESGCQIYEQRPRQCRSYPFWQAVVQAPDRWKSESLICPGIGQGDLHPASEITATAAEDGIPVHRTRMRLDRA